MSVLPESPTTQPVKADGESAEHLRPVYLEARFTPATDSQLLVIETGLRILSVWAVKAAQSAEQAATPT